MRKIVDTPKYSQAELCEIVGLDAVTANNWVLRGVIRPGKIEGRDISRVRLFSETEVFRTKFIFELVFNLGVAPSKAKDITSVQTSQWVKIVERSIMFYEDVYAFVYPGSDEEWKSTIGRREKSSGAILATTGNAPLAFPPSTFVALPISSLVSDLRKRFDRF
jgi:hypothetical protein